MKGMGKLQPVEVFHPPTRRAKSRIRALVARSEVAEDAHHAENTLKWLLRTEPSAGEALQIAALGHDIDRATPERVKRGDYPDYDDFKAAHARRSARLLRGILEDCGLENALIKETCRLVEAHEVGGDPSADLLKDVDSISYFDVNLSFYFQRHGWVESKRRSHWGYRRLTDRAKVIVDHFDYEHQTLNRLMREVKAEQPLNSL
jgi:hypothetical protein